jgi:hypothetical protein
MAVAPECKRDEVSVFSFQVSVFSLQFSAGCESTVFSGIRPKGQHNAIKLFSVNRKPNRRVSIAEN